MYQRSCSAVLVVLPLCIVLCACASTEVAGFAAQTPEEVAAAVAVTQRPEPDGGYDIVAPRISVRAGFSQFATGMLSGGSDFGSAVGLHGASTGAGPVTHRIVAEVQYTNLGGVYRNYDRAGIAGVADLEVVLLDADRHYNINSVNMTETVGIAISDADLRAGAAGGMVLRLSDDSDNLVELTLPASYIAGYLLSVQGAAKQLGPQ
jgi:hypothetical protein